MGFSGTGADLRPAEAEAEAAGAEHPSRRSAPRAAENQPRCGRSADGGSSARSASTRLYDIPLRGKEILCLRETGSSGDKGTQQRWVVRRAQRPRQGTATRPELHLRSDLIQGQGLGWVKVLSLTFDIQSIYLIRNLPAKIPFPSCLPRTTAGCGLRSTANSTSPAAHRGFAGKPAGEKEDANPVRASVNGLFSAGSTEPVSQKDSMLCLS